MNDKTNQFNKLIMQLAELDQIKAPHELHSRIEYAVSLLEDKQPSYSWFSLPVFARSFVIALLLFLFIGGSVIAAAEKSMPGDILYPIKQIITSFKMQLSGEHIPSSQQPVSSPEIASPTPTSEAPLTPSPSTDNTPLFITPTPTQPTEIPIPTVNAGDGVEGTNNEIIENTVPTTVPSLPPEVELQVDAEVPIDVNDVVIADLDIDAGPVNIKLKLGM